MRQHPVGPLRNTWVPVGVGKRRMMSGSILMKAQTIGSTLSMAYPIANALLFLVNSTMISSGIEWPSSGEDVPPPNPHPQGQGLGMNKSIMVIPSLLRIKNMDIILANEKQREVFWITCEERFPCSSKGEAEEEEVLFLLWMWLWGDVIPTSWQSLFCNYKRELPTCWGWQSRIWKEHEPLVAL